MRHATPDTQPCEFGDLDLDLSNWVDYDTEAGTEACLHCATKALFDGKRHCIECGEEVGE